MKKIILSFIMFCVVGLNANSSIQVNRTDETGTPLILNNEMILLYLGDSVKDVQDKESIAKILYDSACNGEEIKKLVNSGTVLNYIYVHEKKITVIHIDKCK